MDFNEREAELFRQYCVNSFLEKDAKYNYSLYEKTMLQLKNEAHLIEKFNPERVYKAQGDYNSKKAILFQTYNKDYISIFDNLFKKLNKDPDDICYLFLEKTNIIKTTKELEHTYNVILKNELMAFKFDYLLNFTDIKLPTKFGNTGIVNIGFDYLALLNHLIKKKDKEDDEIQELSQMTKKLITVFNKFY